MNTLRALFSVLGVAALAACGGNIGAPAGPCDGLDPAEGCGEFCSVDQDCDSGFYCGGTVCTADCTPGGLECGDGQACTDNGQCIDDGTGGGSGSGSGGSGTGTTTGGEDCPDVAVNLNPVTPTVQLVIDQSGSMEENFGDGLDRWEAVGAALFEGFGGATPIVEELEDEVIFGATLYSSVNGNAGGMCPMLNEEPPALNNFATLKALYDNNDPLQDTPTTEAINAVVANFPAPDPDVPAPRIILLATDGEPDTCVDADAHNEVTNGLAEDAVVAAFDAGIRTFVLSVGNDVGANHLQRLANAGAGLDLANGDAEAFRANNPSELVDRFGEIIGRVRSCTFALDGEVDPANTCLGSVVLNGTELQCNVDWRLVDPSTLELLGDACDQLLAADEVALSAVFPCGTVIVE